MNNILLELFSFVYSFRLSKKLHEQNFFTDWSTGNTGLLSNITTTLASDSDSLATNIISNINPNNLAEENEKIVLEIYNETWSKDIFEFTQSQEQTLYDIATQNPITGGTAVYIARAMLDMDVDDFIVENGNRIGIHNDNEIILPTEFESILTENGDNLLVTEKSNSLINEVTVITVFGQTVYKKYDVEIQYSIPLKMFAKGLYIIQVKLFNGYTLTSKYFSK